MRDLTSSKSAALCTAALMTAVGLVLGYIEHIIPFDFGIPGIKLGLANLAVVSVMYLIGAKSAITVSLSRIFLSSLLFGNPFSLIYSLAGGLLSVLIMLCAKRFFKFSCIGVSILGGVFHNIGQIAVAAIILDSLNILLYLPILLIAGALTGAIIGVISLSVIKKLNKLYKEN